jgi:hypothetical protein
VEVLDGQHYEKPTEKDKGGSQTIQRLRFSQAVFIA